MNCKIFCIYLCLLVGAVVLGKEVRIIGGYPTTIQEFPYVVSFRLFPINLLFCAGSIISEWHILTAAHCFSSFRHELDDVRAYTSTASSVLSTGPSYLVQEVITHPDFTGELLYNTVALHDIAIIKVDREIEFNERTKKINLPSRPIMSGDIGFIPGWGFTSYPNGDLSEHLKVIAVQILKKNECIPLFPSVIHNEHLCSIQGIGAGACVGDSGGPLVRNNKIYGVVSFSYRCADGLPDIHANVFEYLDFIRFHLDNGDF